MPTMVHSRSRRASVLLTVVFCVGLVFGWASPSSAEVVADTSTSVIVPCGTQDQPCIQQLQEYQYLTFVLFGMALLVLALFRFWRIEGKALRRG